MNDDVPVSNDTSKEQYNGFELYDPSSNKEENKDIEKSENKNEAKEHITEQKNDKEFENKFIVKADKANINKKM